MLQSMIQLILTWNWCERNYRRGPANADKL